MSSSPQPAYLFKSDFEEEGILPYLQPAGSAEESCSICLSTIACGLLEPTTAAEKQQQELTEVEEAFLANFNSAKDDSASILTLLKRTLSILPIPHHYFENNNDNNKKEEERAEPGAKLVPCGHIFGYKCIEKWLSKNTTCPMCRKELFPCQPWEEKAYWAQTIAEMDAREVRYRIEMMDAYWY